MPCLVWSEVLIVPINTPNQCFRVCPSFYWYCSSMFSIISSVYEYQYILLINCSELHKNCHSICLVGRVHHLTGVSAVWSQCESVWADRWTCGSKWPASTEGLSTSPLPPSPQSPKNKYFCFCLVGQWRVRRKLGKKGVNRWGRSFESFPFCLKMFLLFLSIRWWWWFSPPPSVWKRSQKITK